MSGPHYAVLSNFVPWGLPSRWRYGPKGQAVNMNQLSDKLGGDFEDSVNEINWEVCLSKIQAKFEYFYLNGILSTCALHYL